MRSYAFALLCIPSLLLDVQAGRRGDSGHHGVSGRAGHRGAYGGGYGGHRGGYGGGYGGGRRNGGRNGDGCGGYFAPPPPTNECKPPCHRSYGVRDQEECVCPETTTASPNTCPACECTTPMMTECTTRTTITCTTPAVECTTPKCECEACCRSGYTEFERRCWRLTKESNVNATDASFDCESDGSMLASIQNQAQNEFVRALASTGKNMTFKAGWNPDSSWQHVRIGAVASSNPRVWKWIDNKPFNYSNWVNETLTYPTFPTDTTGAILPDFEPAPGTWNSILHNQRVRKGVCVYDLP